MSRLEDIIARGNRGHGGYADNNIILCRDGFKVSVIAGGGTYCKPRPSFCACWFKNIDGMEETSIYPSLPFEDVPHYYPGPYYEVEVGFPSQRPEPWDEWHEYCEDPDSPTGTVYARVPVDLVRDLIASHGGERDS